MQPTRRAFLGGGLGLLGLGVAGCATSPAAPSSAAPSSSGRAGCSWSAPRRGR